MSFYVLDWYKIVAFAITFILYFCTNLIVTFTIALYFFMWISLLSSVLLFQVGELLLIFVVGQVC